ncbi:GDSL esterase/lipase At1g28590 [Linum perenne]
MGEIGGIDYNRAFFEDVPSHTIIEIVPYVVAEIGKAVEELVELGAVTILVPGNLPIGCWPGYLTKFWSPNKKDYDPLSGCLVWYNNERR